LKGYDVLKFRKWILIPIALSVVIGILGVLFINLQQEKALLSKYDLAKISVVEIVEKLGEEEYGALNATINTEYVTISEGEKSAKVKIPDDKFFLAFAPYINQSKPCSEYNLDTCKGELANQTFKVLITKPNGDVVVEQEMISAENGFVTIWLDKGMEANLVVRYNNLTAKSFITTLEDSNTCITTPLQLIK
jgi:hypothetical protein